MARTCSLPIGLVLPRGKSFCIEVLHVVPSEGCIYSRPKTVTKDFEKLVFLFQDLTRDGLTPAEHINLGLFLMAQCLIKGSKRLFLAKSGGNGQKLGTVL